MNADKISEGGDGVAALNICVHQCASVVPIFFFDHHANWARTSVENVHLYRHHPLGVLFLSGSVPIIHLVEAVPEYPLVPLKSDVAEALSLGKIDILPNDLPARKNL